MKKVAMVLGLVFVVLAFTMSVSDADAGLKDSFNKLRDKGRNLRDGIKNRKRSCSNCGKTIYAGETCLSCKARKVGDGVKERAHPCSNCGKTIYAGKTCLSCKGRSAKDKTGRAWDKTKGVVRDVRKRVRDRKRPCSVCNKTIYVGSRCSGCFSRAAGARGAELFKRGRARSKRLYETAKGKYGVILGKVRDPEVRRKMGETVGAIMEVRAKFKEAKRKGAGKVFGALANIKLPDGRTLGEMASERILDKYPNLAGTGICDDPAETAAALVCDTPGFLLGEAKLLKRNGRSVSVFGAIESSSPYDSDGIVSCLKIVKATADVSCAMESGEGYVEAIASVSSAVKSARQ